MLIITETANSVRATVPWIIHNNEITKKNSKTQNARVDRCRLEGGG